MQVQRLLSIGQLRATRGFVILARLTKSSSFFPTTVHTQIETSLLSHPDL